MGGWCQVFQVSNARRRKEKRAGRKMLNCELTRAIFPQSARSRIEGNFEPRRDLLRPTAQDKMFLAAGEEDT